MRKIPYIIGYVGGLLLSAAALTGCAERELSERPADGVLKIDLVWPDGQSVAGGRIWLYGSNGLLFTAMECGAGGYEGRVPADTYTILAANSDCANADCERSESWQEHRMKASIDTETNTLRHVGKVFCIGTKDVSVQRGNRATKITLYPKNTVKRLHFRIAPDYIDDIAGMNVRMTGIIPSVRLIDGCDAGESTGEVTATAKIETGTAETAMKSITKGDVGGLYSADMSVFGWRGENIVSVMIGHSDGSTEATVPQDLSERLGQLPEEGGTVDLTLVLPDGGEIALTVTVEAWKSGSGSGTVI